MGGRGASGGVSEPVNRRQREYEDSIRNSDIEHGAYFDREGNMLLQGTGNADEITFDPYEMNHQVEQRVWADEIVNFTHNHPENTIFSPEDIEAFERLENHSVRAVLPNGTNYTLIREQPRSSHEWIIDLKTGESRQSYEAKTIAEHYRKAYDKVYDPGYKQVRTLSGEARKEAQRELDAKVAASMEKWLRKNAAKYGYRFEMR